MAKPNKGACSCSVSCEVAVGGAVVGEYGDTEKAQGKIERQEWKGVERDTLMQITPFHVVSTCSFLPLFIFLVFFFFFFVILKRGEGALSALGVERAPLAVSGAVLFCELGFRMGGKRRKWVRA